VRKRSKKRIPQDVVAWQRVTQRDDEKINVFAKKATRWVSGYNRDLQTKLLKTQATGDHSKILLKSFLKSHPSVGVAGHFRSQLQQKFSQLHQLSAGSRLKNFCLFLGKGSTYNRKLHISRQTFRKLARFGLISGLQK